MPQRPDFWGRALGVLTDNLYILPAIGGAMEELEHPDVDEIEDTLVNSETKEVTAFLETPAPDLEHLYRPVPPLFRKDNHFYRFFIDGSLRTYYLATGIEGDRTFPIELAQIGAAVMQRSEEGTVRPLKVYDRLLLLLPKGPLGVSDTVWASLKRLDAQDGSFQVVDTIERTVHTSEQAARVVFLAVWLMLGALTLASCQNAHLGTDRSPDFAHGEAIHTLYSGPELPQFIGADDQYVFWSSEYRDGPADHYGGLRLMRAAKDGTNPIVLVERSERALALAIDGSDVYWASDTGVGKVAKTGGKAVSLVHLQPPSCCAVGNLAVDGDSVYWSTSREDGIWKISKTGAGATQVITGSRPATLVVGGEYLYWTEGGRAHDGKVMRAAKDGSGMTELVGEQYGPLDLIADDHYLYWINQDDPDYHGTYAHGAVLRCPLGGGPLTKLASENTPDHLVADDISLYWEGGDGIQKVSKDGGAVTTLTTVINVIHSLAVDDSRLYFTIPNEGAVYWVDK